MCKKNRNSFGKLTKDQSVHIFLFYIKEMKEHSLKPYLIEVKKQLQFGSVPHTKQYIFKVES